MAQLKGDSMSNLLNPSRGIRDDIERRGGKPKNHARENYQKIKSIGLQKKAVIYWVTLFIITYHNNCHRLV